MIIRWLTLAATPYLLVPFLAGVLMIPSLILWGEVTNRGFSAVLPDSDFAGGIAVACVLAAVCCVGGHRLGYRIARRHMVEERDFLGDPTRG